MSDAVMTSPPVRGIADAAAVAARGNSVVLAAPPSPAYAVPVLAAALKAPADTRTRPILLIAPEAGFACWTDAAARAAALAGKRSAAGTTAARASHHLAGGRVDLLVITLAVAGELIRRSALGSERISALVLAWPELEPAQDHLVPLFAEVPKETARIVITADPVATGSLCERYAWRAPVLGPLGDGAVAQPIARFQTVAVAWAGRAAALGAIADLSDREELAVWTVDESSHPDITARLTAHGTAVRFYTAETAVSGTVVFFDPPPVTLLAQADPTHSVLLVPPGVEGYINRVVTSPHPITIADPVLAAADAIGQDRRVIRERIEAGPDRGAFATLAPLFDRWSAAEVAVAVQSLWLEARTKPAPTPSRAAPAVRRSQPTKVWTNVGKKEGVTFGEWLGLLTLDLGISKNEIGKVDTKETFTVIEFASDTGAKAAVEKLAGHTFKGRRITARIDRGRGRPSA